MALNPSCNSVEGASKFPVLGDPPFSKERAEVAMGEFREAMGGDVPFQNVTSTLKVYKEGSKARDMQRMGVWALYDGIENDTETVERVHVIAKAFGWDFRRMWYYWRCQTMGHPIPMAAAKKLNKTWGKKVRIGGYAGGRDEVKRPVTGYDVDTLDGLKALIEVLRNLR